MFDTLVYNDLLFREPTLSERVSILRDKPVSSKFKMRRGIVRCVCKGDNTLGRVYLDAPRFGSTYWLDSDINPIDFPDTVNGISYWIFSETDADGLAFCVRNRNYFNCVSKINGVDYVVSKAGYILCYVSKSYLPTIT